jgi:hypothetical protein
LSSEEEDVRNGIILAIGGLLLLAGCENKADKAVNAPVAPKWKGLPYRIAFDKPPAKPNAAGVTLPAIKYTANPDALETRATIVIRFDPSVVKTSAVKKDQEIINQMIMAPVDVHGDEGTLPADYMDAVNRNLAGLLGAYCIKGKVPLTVAIARSSLSMTAAEAEIETKRISDWVPVEVVFKNPHPTC